MKTSVVNICFFTVLMSIYTILLIKEYNWDVFEFSNSMIE